MVVWRITDRMTAKRIVRSTKWNEATLNQHGPYPKPTMNLKCGYSQSIYTEKKIVSRNSLKSIRDGQPLSRKYFIWKERTTWQIPWSNLSHAIIGLTLLVCDVCMHAFQLCRSHIFFAKSCTITDKYIPSNKDRRGLVVEKLK